MKFARIGQWAQISECRKYSVSCVRVNDAYRFEAWHLKGGPSKGVSLGIFADATQARAACDEHAAKQAGDA